MGLNVNGPERGAPDTATTDAGAATAEQVDPRRGAIRDLLNELTAWSPRERMHALKVWHQGALSVIHLHVVTVLEAEGPVAMGELADALDVSVASATGIVTRMEKRGLVERRHGEQDRRLVVVHVTPLGEEVFQDMERRRKEGLAKLLAHMSDEELNGFLGGLRALRTARAAAFAKAGQKNPFDTTDEAGDAGIEGTDEAAR